MPLLLSYNRSEFSDSLATKRKSESGSASRSPDGQQAVAGVKAADSIATESMLLWNDSRHVAGARRPLGPDARIRSFRH
jgi:hypothetical protein